MLLVKLKLLFYKIICYNELTLQENWFYFKISNYEGNNGSDVET